MDKSITVIRQSDRRNSAYVPGTKEERLALIWPLTCSALSLGKKYDVEQPLQRHIIDERSEIAPCAHIHAMHGHDRASMEAAVIIALGFSEVNAAALPPSVKVSRKTADTIHTGRETSQ